MSIIARQSTALEFAVGPVLDADGVAVTDCVVADFKLKKTSGNFAALNGSATLTHVSAGIYDLVLTTSDTDTVGTNCVAIDDTVNACPITRFQVIEEAVYDALYAASALGYVANAPVNVAQISGDSTAADNAESFFDGTGYAGTNNVIPTVTTTGTATNVTTVNGLAANVITATSIASDAITAAKIADGAIDAATFAAGAINAAAIASDAITDVKVASDVTIASVTGAVGSVTGAVGSVTGNVGGNVTGSVGSVATGGISSASFAAGAINNAAMSIDGSELTAIPWNAAWDAEVQSECADALTAFGASTVTTAQVNAEVDTALADIHLDHLLATTYDPASKPGAADALLNELVESDGGVARYTANALEQGPSGGGGVADWTADERTALRSILGIPASGTTPDDPTTGILDTIRDAVAGVQSDTNDIQTRLPAALVSGRIDASVGAYQSGLAPLQPTTAGRTLDVTATGAAGIDWGNVENQDATVFLEDTTVNLAVGVTNVVIAQVTSIAANVITAAALASDAVTEIQSGLATAAELAKVPKGDGTATWNATALASINAEADAALSDVGLTTTITGRIDAAVTSRMATYTQPTGFLAATFPSDPADQSQIIDATNALLAAIAALNNLSSAQAQTAAAAALAAYDGPTKAELDAAVAALATASALATVDGVVDDIKAKTEQMVFGVTNELNVNVESMNTAAVNGNGTSGNKWRGA